MKTASLLVAAASLGCDRFSKLVSVAEFRASNEIMHQIEAAVVGGLLPLCVRCPNTDESPRGLLQSVH
jgi:hypothetical protein